MNHLAFTFPLADVEQSACLIARLDAIGFTGFEERDTELIAFVPEQDFDEALFREELKLLPSQSAASFSRSVIEPRNWNAEWEQNFQPVVIGNDLIVRATFHEHRPNFTHEIVIDPKMAFGTGHHATTAMMLQLMCSTDFMGKTVFDFGCGTGILSIMAARLGCAHLTCIDSDERCIASASENFLLNGVSGAHLIHGEKMSGGNSDIILANINRNVILSHFSSFRKHLNPQGMLFISGFLITDEEEVKHAAVTHSFRIMNRAEQDGWLALVLQ